jgi:RHS repeat-associated protein
MAYFPPTSTQGGERLSQISYANQGSSTAFSQFGYAYNADGLVNVFSVTSPAAQTTSYLYDPANRLKTGQVGSTTPYAYSYDPASNLTSITTGGATKSYSYTTTNEIAGSTYDLNGSPTTLGPATYVWDGENRIVQYTRPASSAVTTFYYNGLGQLVRVVSATSGTVTADNSYFWCGDHRCLSHNNLASSAVTNQYFAQGEIASGKGYYFVRDQLGSVTQLITQSATSAAQFSFDPYGNRKTVSGTVASDIGYAGYWFHAASGLSFTRYRAYDPVHARWLNRDPIGEAGGINLYAYVRGNPLRFTDPFGLCPPNDSYTIPGSGVIPPGAPPLTDDQIQRADEDEGYRADAEAAAAAALAQGNWAEYYNQMDLAYKFLRQWYVDTGTPIPNDPLPHPPSIPPVPAPTITTPGLP